MLWHNCLDVKNLNIKNLCAKTYERNRGTRGSDTFDTRYESRVLTHDMNRGFWHTSIGSASFGTPLRGAPLGDSCSPERKAAQPPGAQGRLADLSLSPLSLRNKKATTTGCY